MIQLAEKVSNIGAALINIIFHPSTSSTRTNEKSTTKVYTIELDDYDPRQLDVEETSDYVIIKSTAANERLLHVIDKRIEKITSVKGIKYRAGSMIIEAS